MTPDKKDKPLDQLELDQVLKTQADLHAAKEKTIKKGDNVIHLEHLGEFSEADLATIQANLEKKFLELSSFDKSGLMVASLDEYTLLTYILLTEPIIKTILTELGTNAIWDSIKWTTIYAWGKVKGKRYTKITSADTKERAIKFGLKIHLDDRTKFDLELSGDLEVEDIERVLDKGLDYLKDLKPNLDHQHPDYLKYSKTEDKLIRLVVLDELKKKKKKKKKKERRK